MNRPNDVPEADQDHRDRMSTGLNRNIAVRASAGSGKTRSTVDRIVAMALDEKLRECLPQLVVVTFTNAAADELRTRARKRLIEEHHDQLKHLAGEIIPKFGQIFFGTIHSFCMRILREFGHVIGLPAELESIEDKIEEIHERFRREREEEIWESLDRRETLRVFRFGLSFDDLVAIAKKLSMLPIDCAELAGRPEVAEFDVLKEAAAIRLDPDALEGVEVKKNSENNIRSDQRRYREFCLAWNAPDGEGGFVAMLGAPKSKAKDIQQRSSAALGRVHDWYARSVIKLGLQFAAQFQDYRREKGQLTFHDQIRLAARLSALPEVLKPLRARNLRVILDEAQDTIPLQFRILTELTRPIEAVFGAWPSDPGAHPPRPGHFVMVGDEQQCIYASSGADIECYMRHGDVLEPAVFKVTFRCSRTVVTFINERFPKILHGEGGQARFVELVARHGAADGGVGRIEIAAEQNPPKKPETAFDREMELLAAELKKLGPRGLGAESWSDVAVLMPRNEWLGKLAACLDREGVPCRMTARRKNRDAVAWRWFAALVTVLAGHDDGYELAGVLREIFGISDAEMAQWVFSKGRIDLDSPAPAGSACPGLRALLEELRSLKRRMAGMSALEAVDEMAKTCALGPRIEALKTIRGVVVGPVDLLKLLRGQAAEAEANGESWKEFAASLMDRAQDEMPELLPSDGREAIVLMTCQSAKGQEWPVVVLPGLHRPMKPPPVHMEKIESASDAGSFAWRVKGIPTSNWAAVSGSAKVREEHQIRRVYYVACTRAKRHLILVDARKTWSGVGSKLTRPIHALSVPEEGDAWMDRIDLWRAPAQERAPAAAAAATTWSGDLNLIERIAAPRLVRPSDSDVESAGIEAEEREEQSMIKSRVEPLHGALIYGNWWHETMFRADWNSAAVADELKLRVNELPSGELRDRGRVQIEKFLGSSLCRELMSPGVRFHREVPYARMLEKDGIEDGKIDLIYEKDGAWQIVDWKTDVVADLAAAKARAKDRYAVQLNAYVVALQAFNIPTGKARLYFTAVGEMVPVSVER